MRREALVRCARTLACNDAARRNALQAFRALAQGARLSALHRGIFGASTLGHLPQAFWRCAHSDPAAWRHDLRPGIACCSPGGGGSPLPEGIVPPSGRLRAAGRWDPLPALSELPPLRVVVPEARSPGSPGRGVTSPTRGCRFRLHPLARLRKTPFASRNKTRTNNPGRESSSFFPTHDSKPSGTPERLRRTPV